MKQNKGFSLLEMLISVMLLGLMVGGSVAAFARVAARNSVKNAGGEFIGIVRSVQAKAQSGEKPDDCLDEELIGWKIVFYDSKNYGIGAYCDSTPETPATALYIETDKFTLPSSVEFVDWPIGGDMLFNWHTGILDQSETVILTSGEKGYDFTVIISAAGSVDGVVE